MIDRAVKVILILVALLVTAAVVAPNVIGRIDAYQISKAEKQILNIADEVEEYERRNGLYPATLAEAIENNGSDTVTTDPWGHAYNFSAEAPFVTVAEHPYYVWSLGRDNRVGGEGIDQDRGNWN